MLLSGKRIFLIEDKPANAHIIITALQIEGALTHFDRWGTHIINRLTLLPKIDLILMDLMLPNGVTGYDVFDKIKAVNELSKIPIVVVSASDPDVEMNKARAKGFSGYIAKPIDFMTFPKIIHKVLEGNEVWTDDAII